MPESPPTDLLSPTDPPILLAILLAANRTGDDLLEEVARRELEDKHGIDVRLRPVKRREVAACR